MKKNVLVMLISAFTTAFTHASAQTSGNSFKGIYRGTFSNGDDFSLVVSKNNDASVFIVGRVSRGVGLFSNFTVSEAGSFALNKDGTTLSGRITSQGSVSGTVPQRNQTFSGTIVAGNSIYGGYYLGTLRDRLGVDAACFFAISADGRTLFYLASPALEDGAVGVIDGQGRLTMTTASGAIMTGAFSTSVEGGGFSGTLTSASYGVLSFSVARKDASYRISNIATRGFVGTGANAMFAGFSVSSGAKTVLIRAAGPSLGVLGVEGTLADPKLEVYDSSARMIASNDNWSSSTVTTSNSVGAFPFQPLSKDSVLVLNLEPGNYSAQVSGVGNTTGVAIVEVYEVR
jgi:hypothetical protein